MLKLAKDLKPLTDTRPIGVDAPLYRVLCQIAKDNGILVNNVPDFLLTIEANSNRFNEALYCTHINDINKLLDIYGKLSISNLSSVPHYKPTYNPGPNNGIIEHTLNIDKDVRSRLALWKNLASRENDFPGRLRELIELASFATKPKPDKDDLMVVTLPRSVGEIIMYDNLDIIELLNNQIKHIDMQHLGGGVFYRDGLYYRYNPIENQIVEDYILNSLIRQGIEVTINHETQ